MQFHKDCKLMTIHHRDCSLTQSLPWFLIMANFSEENPSSPSSSIVQCLWALNQEFGKTRKLRFCSNCSSAIDIIKHCCPSTMCPLGFFWSTKTPGMYRINGACLWNLISDVLVKIRSVRSFFAREEPYCTQNCLNDLQSLLKRCFWQPKQC